jgi:dihydrofolate reductase
MERDVSRVVAQTFVTLDGVMEAPEKWQLPNDLFDEAMGPFVGGSFEKAEALLLGRRTYEEFAAFWPAQPDSDPFAAQMNSLPKIVVTKTLKKLEWKNSTRLEGDLVEEVGRLRQRPGRDILIIGSGQLVSGLTPHGLIDEYQFILHPIVVGRGKKLFADGIDPTLLELVDSKAFGTGVIALTYRPRGKAKLG